MSYIIKCDLISGYVGKQVTDINGKSVFLATHNVDKALRFDSEEDATKVVKKLPIVWQAEVEVVKAPKRHGSL